METSEILRRKINSAKDLHSVVRTMKSLAAVSIRQYEKAVESLSDYYRTIVMGFQIVLRQRPELLSRPVTPLQGRLLGIVFGSDHGMAGQFNDVIASFAMKRMKELRAEVKDWTVWVVGERAEARLDRMGLQIEELYGVPGAVSGISMVVRQILIGLEMWRSQEGNERIILFHNQPLSGASFRPKERQLLPIDRDWLKQLSKKSWPTHILPTFTMNPDRLLSALIGQFLFVSLFGALAESLASENVSRLTAMQGAEKNIEERVRELNFRYHQRRQSAITEELLDVVAGFEALTGEQ